MTDLRGQGRMVAAWGVSRVALMSRLAGKKSSADT
jgi:hypothetical protein